MAETLQELLQSPPHVWGKFYLDHCICQDAIERAIGGTSTFIVRLDKNIIMRNGNTYYRHGADYLDPTAQQVFFDLGLIE